MGSPIYLDNQASTPLDPRVANAMEPILNGKFGNPHSQTHLIGFDSAQIVESAREKVANLIGAFSEEVYFTSGATESNNIVLLGLGEGAKSGRKRVLVSAIEHKAVLSTASPLAAKGYQVEVIPVSTEGLVDLDVLLSLLDEDVALVSVMLVNNEIGVIQPIEQISQAAHKVGALIHTDAAQAAGKLEIDVEKLDVDFLSLTAHKIYGPIGVGALWVRPHFENCLTPISFGGGQERGLRSGTLSPLLCAGFGEAAELAVSELDHDGTRIAWFKDAFVQALDEAQIAYRINGSMRDRVPHNLNVLLENVEAAGLLTKLYHLIAASAGSACNSQNVEPSHVLLALGLSETEAAQSVRLSFGRLNTEEEILTAATLFAAAVKELQASATATAAE